MERPLFVLAVALAGLGVAVAIVARRSTGSKRGQVRELDDRLAETLGPDSGSHLDQAPTVRQLAVVDRAGERAFVPVVRVDLNTTDAPGMAIIFDYVAAVLEAIHPVFDARGDRVHHYDIQFTFGPGGLIVAGECQRVSVPPELADRLLTDGSYRARDLWQDIKRGDRTEAATTLWGECREY